MGRGRGQPCCCWQERELHGLPLVASCWHLSGAAHTGYLRMLTFLSCSTSLTLLLCLAKGCTDHRANNSRALSRRGKAAVRMAWTRASLPRHGPSQAPSRLLHRQPVLTRPVQIINTAGLAQLLRHTTPTVPTTLRRTEACGFAHLERCPLPGLNPEQNAIRVPAALVPRGQRPVAKAKASLSSELLDVPSMVYFAHSHCAFVHSTHMMYTPEHSHAPVEEIVRHK